MSVSKFGLYAVERNANLPVSNCIPNAKKLGEGISLIFSVQGNEFRASIPEVWITIP